jgi:hypothetical protein
MAHFLSVSNWERFQHYKDRDPPWVKLYRDLLTSESWVLGNDLSRVVQVASIMLAPRYGNQIPFRFDLLRKVMNLDCTEAQFIKAVQHLTDTKFLVIQQLPTEQKETEQSASSVLASCTSETDQIRAEKRQSREREARARPARQVPDSFAVTEDMRSWAQRECPGVNVDAETAKFRDHEFAKPRTDWLKAWRNWLRRSGEMGSSRVNGSPRKSFAEQLAALDPDGEGARELGL